ncbi:hypothetical protein ACFSKL_21225 [Belliella marina]|uniref:Uncharacterized protein n=1 Tax=Belliella marina TaxID=1644146 RepID=A0ABW4VSX3_9BACT
MKDDFSGGAPIKSNYTGVEGTPFLYNFERGDIFYSKKDTATNMFIRFNAYEQVLEYLKGEDIWGLTPSQVKGFVVVENQERAFYTSEFKLPNSDKPVFFKVHNLGEIGLLEYIEMKLVEDPGSTYGSLTKKFSPFKVFFILIDGDLIEFKHQKKYLKGIFNEKYSKVQEHMNSYNLNLKNETDLKKLIDFINNS